MAAGSWWSRFAISRGAIGSALLLTAFGATIVGGLYTFVGPNSAQAAYLSMMLLLSPVRALPVRWRIGAAVWAVAIALLGFSLGIAAPELLPICLLLVCLVQGFFRLGSVASMTRSPVNLLVFAGLSHTEVATWHVFVGAVVGAGFLLLFSFFLPGGSSAPLAPAPLRARLSSGVMLASGALLILWISSAIDYPYVSWVLLSYCMILAVDTGHVVERARSRILGTVAGAIAATLITLAPQPVPIIAAVIAVVLCVAYARSGNYAMFVTFLTPAVLLTTSSEKPAYIVGIGRIEAVLAAAIIALAVTFITHQLAHTRLFQRSTDAPFTPQQIEGTR
ncbi:FUSC family protein [Mycetocola tolaasinivorans]|nr:FUSC family protein [Mycetocola tolaasinivorans]